MSIAVLKSELKTLAQKGCGDCFAQDCEWPDCSPKAKAIKEELDKLAAPVQAQESYTTLPERDTTKPAEQQGLFKKFVVKRVDGSDDIGGKHYGCEYFVLDVDHDQHAQAALRAYAKACAETHPQLSADLVARCGTQDREAADMLEADAAGAQPVQAQERKPTKHEDAVFVGRGKFLEWNRALRTPLVTVAHEYPVFDAAIRCYNEAAHGIKEQP